MGAGKWPRILKLGHNTYSLSMSDFFLFLSEFLFHVTEVGSNDSCDSLIFFYSELNEIWHIDRGRWVMHDGMQYDPIQGQGHEPLKVGNSTICEGYLFRSFIMGAGK